MKSKLLTLSAIAFCANLGACSTIVNGSNQSLDLSTGAVAGANCILTGGSNFKVNETFTTPARVEVPRSKKALEMACSKAGYKDATETIYSKIEATTGGNLLLGGPIGAGIDAATGALYKYPETVVLEMESLNSIQTAPIAR